jgi:Invasion associated locus B (IalB) protein
MKMKYVILVSALLLSTSGFAAKHIGSYKNWSVFTLKQGKDMTCYTVAAPKGSTGTFKKRDKPYIMVSFEKGRGGQVASYSGYPYKVGSTVGLDVDAKWQFDLFTSAETPGIAWAKDSAGDLNAITRMKNGYSVSVSAESQKGTTSKDTYSLDGFAKAYAKSKELCK